MSLYEKIGESKPSYLLAKAEGADPIGINLTPGQGTVKAGTVLFKESNGMYSPAAAADAVITKDLVVLSEEVDTGDAPDHDGAAIAETAVAYRAGHFVDGRVFLKSDAALTDAIKIVLRAQGIVFNQMDGVSNTFDNGSHTITYVANNSASPAEADYVDNAMPGSYTVLGNDTTGFTAPATKSFSKWNTKADGSGTDYAAAATLTVSGDVKLYAIWA